MYIRRIVYTMCISIGGCIGAIALNKPASRD